MRKHSKLPYAEGISMAVQNVKWQCQWRHCQNLQPGEKERTKGAYHYTLKPQQKTTLTLLPTLRESTVVMFGTQCITTFQRREAKTGIKNQAKQNVESMPEIKMNQCFRYDDGKLQS